MRIDIILTGITPMLMHNERLSDPSDEYVRQIAELTAKRKDQTDTDRDNVSYLEWLGGLYSDSGKVVIPTRNVIKSLRDAGVVTKDGKKILTALSPTAMYSLLIFPDEKIPIPDLYKKSQYVDRRQVGIGKRRIKRTRPIFPSWSTSCRFEFLPDIINFERLVSIAELAGTAIGLGDARILGHGRFTAKITKV